MGKIVFLIDTDDVMDSLLILKQLLIYLKYYTADRLICFVTDSNAEVKTLLEYN